MCDTMTVRKKKSKFKAAQKLDTFRGETLKLSI